ncbi:MAG: hypothetical protein M1822_007753 [Bathelium mastoideum]|nr:MAG: hypothetical protein M1822_007753 [Bathelium mastoideum]
MDIELRDVKFNGTLWPPANPSWMRAEPSEEVDELWEAYEPKDVFAVTADDVRSLGYDPAHVVKFEDDYWGLGDDAYMAGFDMLHKTHCLNELRRMTFEDYGQPKGFYKEKHHGKLWWIHLRHCVDMLMQDQLCHADADVILFHWVDTQSYPWPDLSVTKKCRNWDQMLEWGTSRYVQYDKLVGMTKPKNAHIIPFERGYYEQYGFEDSIFFPNGTGYEW